jgi:glycosyltransferase involved in cell wall biosynthesis
MVLASALSAAGHDVMVLAPRSDGSRSATSYAVRLVPSVRTPYGDFRFSWASPRRVARVIEGHRPDVVHVHTLGPLGVLASLYCRRHRLKRVLTWHTDFDHYRCAYPVLNCLLPLVHATWSMARSPMRVLATLGGLFLGAVARTDVGDFYRAMLGDVVSSFDHVVSPSLKAASRVLETRAVTYLHVIPTPAMRPLPLPKSQQRLLRDVLSRLHTGPRAVVFVGRLSAEKNLDALLRVLGRHVLPRCPDVRLNVVGDGRGKAAVQAKARLYGVDHAVFFAGGLPRELVPHVLERCAVLAHPALSETQGLVIGEAALAGVPAVVMDPELVNVVEHGVGGYVTHTESSFAAALVEVVENPALRAALGRGARARSHAYTPGHFAHEMVRVYKGAMVG